MSNQFVSDVNSGLVVITVDGIVLSVVAEHRHRAILNLVTEPAGQTRLVDNQKLYSGTGGGLGALLVLAVVVLVILIIVICYYHK